MHLIAPLCAGVNGCGNGTARLFRRGTATRAAWYNTFEASAAADSSGADIALDSNGGVVAYVNELVEVECYSSLGVLVRSFIAGAQAYAVEAISPAFTGVDYETGVASVSKPTTVGALLDRWLESAGSLGIDWKVELDGAAVTLENALGALIGLVFNVKSPAYGAVGDGVADDTAAISAALAAAVAAGGGTVFFPEGTYLISSAIAWSHLVNIVGVGAALSVITTNSASNARIFTWTAGTARATPQLIYGITLQSSQSNSGEQLYASVAVNWLVSNIRTGGSTTSIGTGIAVTGASKLRVYNSRITSNTSGSGYTASTTTAAYFYGCTFDVGTTTYGGGALAKPTGKTTFKDCSVDITTVTTLGGTIYGLQMQNAADVLHVEDCVFTYNAQDFDQGIFLVASAVAVVRGNKFAAGMNVYQVAAVPLLAAGSWLQPSGDASGYTAGCEVVRNAAIGTGVTVPFCDLFEGVGSTTVPTMVMPAMYYPGQRLRMMLRNTSGVGWGANVTVTGAQFYGVVATNAGNTEVAIFDFEVSDLVAAGTYTWACVSAKIGSAN